MVEIYINFYNGLIIIITIASVFLFLLKALISIY